MVYVLAVNMWIVFVVSLRFQMKFANLFDLLFLLFSPFLPLDRGTTQTAIQVHAVKLMEIRLGQRWQLVSNQS